jgi:hypothetical protein
MLTKADFPALRERVEQGEVLSLETLKEVIALYRKSYSALPQEKQAKTRNSKPTPPTEDQLEFF